MWDDLVKRLREGVVCVDSDVAGVSGVISESKTDALCYEAADMIEELEAIVASLERDIHEMEKRNEN
jgi:outer membrane murein-binding lipoprotein Lpp